MPIMKIGCSLLFLWFCFCAVQAQDFEGLRKINGASLYFKIMGSGEPLVIVHGGPGMNHSYFMPHLDDLSKKFKIVFYDQRACGRSAIPSTDSISLQFLVDDLEAIRKDLGVEKLNLLGHSWGAIPVVDYGIRYPDKVKGMILCNPVPLSREFDQEMLENQKMKSLSRDSTDRSIIMGSKDFKSGNPDAYKKLLILGFRNSFYKPSNFLKLRYDMPANFADRSRALFAGLGRDLGQYNFYDTLKSFSFPVLIMHGASDVIPLKALTRMQQKMPKASLKVFSKSGHFIFIEEPGKFKSVVDAFLKSPL